MLKSIFVFITLLYSLLLAEDGMRFSLKTDYMNHRAEIYASGDLERGTALKFVNFIKQNNIGRAIVYLNSYGGSLEEGMLLGRIIREMGYETSIGTTKSRMAGICASACSYAFAGGVARYIYYDKQRLGLHQFYSSDGSESGSIADTQKMTANIVNYLSEMGVDEQAFVVASSTHKNSMTWLTKAEAIKLNFANNGKNKTKAEIKLMSGDRINQKPYLKIEQEKVEGTGKFLFYCLNNTMYVRGMILTNEENSLIHSQNVKRHYFVLNDGEFLVQEGQNGISAKNRSISLDRKLSGIDIDRILNSDVMNMWIENGSEFRWGIEVDIYPVKEQIREFTRSCNIVESRDDLDTALGYF